MLRGLDEGDFSLRLLNGEAVSMMDRSKNRRLLVSVFNAQEAREAVLRAAHGSYGISELIAGFFDGRQIDPSSMEREVRAGYEVPMVKAAGGAVAAPMRIPFCPPHPQEVAFPRASSR
jgi:hypothetical protein